MLPVFIHKALLCMTLFMALNLSACAVHVQRYSFLDICRPNGFHFTV